MIIVKALRRLASKICQAAGAHLDALPLRLGTEDIRKRRALDRHLRLVLFQTIDVLLLSQQAHGQLVRLEQDLVRVTGFFGHCFPEGRQIVLGDNLGKPMLAHVQY